MFHSHISLTVNIVFVFHVPGDIIHSKNEDLLSEKFGPPKLSPPGEDRIELDVFNFAQTNHQSN